MNGMQEQNKLTREEQTEVTRVLVKTAQMLASCGAESRIIEQTTCRLGKTLGMESVRDGDYPQCGDPDDPESRLLHHHHPSHT